MHTYYSMRRSAKRRINLIKKILPRIALIIVAILAGLIFLSNQDLSARGRQFKGILPPRDAQPSRDEPEPEVIAEEIEPEYPQLNMIVNIPARTVTLYDEGKEVARHDIAVGQPRYKTPVGPMEINTIIWNPWWIPPNSPWARGAKRQPPGPKNCLGPVKMLMGRGIRLHGTNKDSSVGRAASHGCLRMHNPEARSLAWYIQKRMNQTDDKYLDKYKKHRRTSFYVKLVSPVIVDIIYKPVEVRNDIIYIYKDIYGWAKDIKTEVVDALLQAGINLKKIDAKKIAKLKFPKGRSHIREVPINNVLLSKYRTKDEKACVADLEEPYQK